MAEMLAALPSDFWEMTPPSRDAFIAEQYPHGVPDDFVTLIGYGAQADIQALRLDASTLAVASGAGRAMPFPDGYHQIGYDMTVLRRNTDGWQNLTSTVFPFRIAPYSNVALNKDGTVFVTDEHRKHPKRYRFDGRRFTKVSSI